MLCNTEYSNTEAAMEAGSGGAERDLAKIRSIMEEGRRTVYEGGRHYILWGILMAAALMTTYAAVLYAWPDWTALVWPVAVGLGWAGSMWIGYTDHARAPVHTLAGRVLGAIWIGFGITATIIGFAGPGTGAINIEALAGVMAVLLGSGYFASSFLYGFGWVRWLSVAWWAGGVAMMVWPGAHTLPALAAMMILLQVVPGLVFYSRQRREPERHAA